MTDFLGYTSFVFLIVFMISSIAVYARGSAIRRAAFAAAAALWAAFSAGAASAGLTALAQPFPLMGLFVAAPLVAMFAASRFETFKDTFRSVPIQLLIGLNAARIVAFLFFALQSEGRLSGPFPVAAGWGDIISGILATVLALSAGRSSERRGFWIAVLAWNLFGTADLLDAIVLGVTSTEGSLYIFREGSGAAAMQVLPFSLIPTVIVPFYLGIHGYIFVRVAAALRRLKTR
jgi:hypothetical protein